MRRVVLMFVLGLAAGETAGPDPRSCLRATRLIAEWRLPASMREASGLAAAGPNLVWVHADETSDVILVNALTGAIIARTRLGSVALRGDFEGIALVGRDLYLVTSDGVLVRGTLPTEGRIPAMLPAASIDTRLGRSCEIEGLEEDATHGVLLLACKTPRRKSLEGKMTLFRWDVEAGRLAVPDRITVPDRTLLGRPFQSSGVTRDPQSGQLLILSSHNRRLAILDANNHVLGNLQLRAAHIQPEGIAWLGNGRVAIADEGKGGNGMLRIYQCGK